MPLQFLRSHAEAIQWGVGILEDIDQDAPDLTATDEGDAIHGSPLLFRSTSRKYFPEQFDFNRV